MKKMILICALAAAMTGLSSCTDLSYSEFDDESNAAAPDSTVSAAITPIQDSSAEINDDQSSQQQDTPTDTSELDTSSADSSLADQTISEPDASEYESSADSSSKEPADMPEYTPQYLAYREIISEYRERFLDTDSELGGEYCRYYIADIDLDGTYELICETGTFQADRTAYVFTFDGERVIRLGDFITWHAELVEAADRIYSETLAMGSSSLYEIRIDEGVITTERAMITTADMPFKKLSCYGYDDPEGLDVLLETPTVQWFDIYN